MDTQGRIERPFYGFAGRAIANLALCDVGSPAPNRTEVIRFRAGRFATKLRGVKIGQGGWSRSSGLSLPKQALFRLSYTLVRMAGFEPAFSIQLPLSTFVMSGVTCVYWSC
jgi:hypothetical protein